MNFVSLFNWSYGIGNLSYDKKYNNIKDLDNSTESVALPH
jgi:hypothetical protein